MQIPKQQILSMIESRMGAGQAQAADSELPDQVDHEQHASLLSKFGITTAVAEVRARHAREVTVVGYTDKIGNPAANRSLSLERARKVAAAVRRQLKEPSVSVRTEARGETHPVAPNTTPQGRQLDRRVAIFITR